MSSSSEMEDIHHHPDTGIFSSSSYDDDFGGTVTNLAPSIVVDSVPTKRVNTIHPQSQILGDLTSPVQTRGTLKKSKFGASAFVSYVHDQQRNNHTDYLHSIQEEMQQFITQKVWQLVPLPVGKIAIGTKWILKNKRDAREEFQDIILVQVYVDDIIFGSTNKAWCDKFEVLMKGEFEMSAMGELTFFLGLQVIQKSNGIFISQDKYVQDMLTKFDMVNVRSATTPFEATNPKSKEEPDEAVNVHLYRSMIGSLMYLTASRPDIQFAVSACSRHQVTPLTSHLNAVKRIFKYLKGRPKLGLWYPRDSPFVLEAYSDSDYAGSHGDRKSTTGGCQFLGRRLISWQCKKQTIVATSSTEAEYVAAANCCGQVTGSDVISSTHGDRSADTTSYCWCGEGKMWSLGARTEIVCIHLIDFGYGVFLPSVWISRQVSALERYKERTMCAYAIFYIESKVTELATILTIYSGADGLIRRGLGRERVRGHILLEDTYTLGITISEMRNGKSYGIVDRCDTDTAERANGLSKLARVQVVWSPQQILREELGLERGTGVILVDLDLIGNIKRAEAVQAMGLGHTTHYGEATINIQSVARMGLRFGRIPGGVMLTQYDHECTNSYRVEDEEVESSSVESCPSHDAGSESSWDYSVTEITHGNSRCLLISNSELAIESDLERAAWGGTREHRNNESIDVGIGVIVERGIGIESELYEEQRMVGDVWVRVIEFSKRTLECSGERSDSGFRIMKRDWKYCSQAYTLKGSGVR
ncbi:uncharacterized mitochondrial protein-like protein [Tanacetum coccineum]